MIIVLRAVIILAAMWLMGSNALMLAVVFIFEWAALPIESRIRGYFEPERVSGRP